MKKALALMLALAMSAAMLVGCGGNAATQTEEKTEEKAEEEAEEPAADEAALNIFISYGLGGLGDFGFNDAAQKGVKTLASEYGCTYTEYEPKSNAEVEAQVMAIAQSGEYDLIIGVGYDNQGAIDKASEACPDQKFLIVQGMVDRENVITVAEYMEQQGYMAGLYVGNMILNSDYDLSADNAKVGFILGTESDNNTKKFIGFQAGLKSLIPDAEVLYKVNGSWTDTAKAKELALACYDEGAQIVWHLTGAAGKGCFEAAAERDLYVLGCNGNQNEWDPVHCLASMQNALDVQIASNAKTIIDGQFQGGIRKMGFEDGIYYVDLEGTDAVSPDAVLEAVQAGIDAVVAGDIEIPTDEDALAAFLQ